MDETRSYTQPDRDTSRNQATDNTPGCLGGAFGLVLAGLIAAMIWIRRNKMSEEQTRQEEHQAELEKKREIGHETSDADVRGIALAGVVLVVVVAGVAVALWGLFVFFAYREAQADVPPPPLATPQQLPPEPRLQVAPAQDWQRMRATDTALLNSYGWVDQEAGVVRIPVERSMALLAEEGLPIREGAAGQYYTERVPDLESSGGQLPEDGSEIQIPWPTGTVPLQPIGTPQPAETASPQPDGAGAPQPGETPAAVTAGAQLFQSLGCVSCHRMGDNGVGPSLAGLFGSRVELASGETVTADEEYIRNSILDPNAQVVAGYQPVMPSFEGRISEEELSQLVAYIQSLEGGETDGGTR